MNNEKIFIGIGAVAVIVVGFFMFNANKTLPEPQVGPGPGASMMPTPTNEAMQVGEENIGREIETTEHVIPETPETTPSQQMAEGVMGAIEATPDHAVSEASTTEAHATEVIANHGTIPVSRVGDDFVLGNVDAPITIVEYASLSCSHCASFHNQILPTLKQQYIQTGKAKLVFRDFPLNRPAFEATILAHCAPDEKYYGVLSILFAAQTDWLTEDYQQSLKDLGQLAGVSPETYDACMEDETLAELIRKRMEEGQKKYEIRSTPTFIINDETTMVGARPIEQFAEALDAILAGDTQGLDSAE